MTFRRIPTAGDVEALLTRKIKSHLIDGHTCNVNTCTIVNINVHIYRGQDESYCVQTKYLPPVDISDKKYVKDIFSLYICSRTGKIHNCSDTCDGDKISNDDNCMVCTISGIQYQSESVRSWKIKSRCTVPVVANKQDPYMFSRNSDGSVKLGVGAHNMTLAKCIQNCQKCIRSLLFSKRRLANEVSKQKDCLEKAQKLVNKYKRHCEKHKIPINYMHAVTILINAVKRRPGKASLLQKNDHEMNEIVDQYTRAVISYWRLIIHKTKLGVEMRTTFHFKPFVISCLYLLKNGVQMNGVYILDKSRFLESALPEANTLDAYDVNKPTFTQTKNNILMAIRETIESNTQTPTSMREYCLAEANKITL
jgi:hypothetical protein